MSSYHYFAGADGLRCCYAAEVTIRCPNTGTDAEVDSAAAALSCDEAKLRRILDRAHTRYLRERDEATGKFTGRCLVCGRRLSRVGFAAWKEREKSEAETTGERVSMTLLGYATEQVAPRRYFDTKREAIEWCREEARISRNAAAEEAGR